MAISGIFLKATNISYHLTFTFLLAKLELLVEALNVHEGVLYGGLHGNSELVPLLPKFYEDLLHIFNPKREEEVLGKETPSRTLQTKVGKKGGGI